MSVELEEFIQETLGAICRGVSRSRDGNEQVAPIDYAKGLNASLIEFDLALTVSENSISSEESGRKFKIGIWKSDISTNKGKAEKSEEMTSTVSRIKFTVPVYLQYSKENVERTKNELRRPIHYNE